MSFWVTDRYGAMDEDVSVDRMRELLDSLADDGDVEHAEVSLTHESEWCLGVFPGGLVIWENVAEGDDIKHRADVGREETLRLWQLLAAGKIAEVASGPWLAGYGRGV